MAAISHPGLSNPKICAVPRWRVPRAVLDNRFLPPNSQIAQKRLLSPLTLQSAPPLALGVVVASVFIVVETVAVAVFNQVGPMESFEVLYVPGVLVMSTVWGVGVATATSLSSAIALAYFHDWPRVHWMPLDLATVATIVVFLVAALLTNFVAYTARARAREARVLAEHQTALRQVATLVARRGDPSEVFSAVAQEMARCRHVANTEVIGYDGTDAITVIA